MVREAGEVGLRVAHARADRRRGRPRVSKSRWRSPRGPVYLVLPREPLSAPLAEPIGPIKPRRMPAPRASRSAIDRDAGGMDRRGRAPADHHRRAAGATPWRRSARSPNAAPFRWSRQCRAPCACRRAIRCISASSPGALLTDADLVIVLECRRAVDSELQHPPAGCRVAHIGEDPFFVRYPMRSFPSDLAIQAGAASALEALNAARSSRACRWRKRASPRAARG